MCEKFPAYWRSLLVTGPSEGPAIQPDRKIDVAGSSIAIYPDGYSGSFSIEPRVA
jgi:hypothetical protein